jgi:hypothetical protein
MINFLIRFILSKNTKYFTYLRFFIIGIILIPVILISFKPIPIAEAQPMDLGGEINGTVSPIHASTSITISGAVTGDATDNGNCMAFCGEGPTFNDVEAHGVMALRYRIDGGTWVSITGYLSQTQQGENSFCPCIDYILYRYSYSRIIDITSLPQGNHTINVRAESQSGATWETGPMPFDNIPFDFQIAPDIDAGSVYQGGSHGVGIRVGRLQGQVAAVSLTEVAIQNLPANSTAVFFPTSCIPNNECVSGMTITTQYSTTPSLATPPGTYNLIITGRSGTITHTANYALTVIAVPEILITGLAADPSAGQAPLLDVGIIVNSNGTATGPMTIQIDCQYNGTTPTFDYAVNTNPASMSYYYGPTTTGAGTVCDYPLVTEDSYMVLVRVTRGGFTDDETVMVTTTLTSLDECTRKAQGGGARIMAGISESWPTNSMHIYETAGTGPSLRGGFYEMDFCCTGCLAEDVTDYRTGEITSFEYRFDNTGLWMPLNKFPTYPYQWGDERVAGLDGCYSWTGCCLPEASEHDMYWFDFNFDISGLSVGDHTLNLRAREEWSHEGGNSPNCTNQAFDPYGYSSYMYQNIPFARNGSPGIELIGPANGSYINAASPSPTFQARVTDPNVGQPLFAHFEVVGFNPNGIGSTTTTPNISSWGPVVGIPDGTYFWQAQAEDSVGAKSSWSGYWSFIKDTSLPTPITTAVIQPAGSTTIRVTFNDVDSGTGVNWGEAQVQSRTVAGSYNGNWVATGMPAVGLAYGGAYVDFSGTNGYCYQFHHRDRDVAGNASAGWSTPVEICLAVNTSPAVPSNLSPAGVTNVRPTGLSARVTDPDGGNVTGDFTFGTAGFSNTAGSTVTSGNNSTITNATFTTLAEGSYSWSVHARDPQGLQSAEANASFILDMTLPWANIDYDSGTLATSLIQLRLTGGDDRTSIAANSGRIEVSTDGGTNWSLVASGVSTAFPATYNFTGTNGWTYIFRFRVVDGAGNISLWDIGGSTTINMPIQADIDVGPVGGLYDDGPYVVVSGANVGLNWTISNVTSCTRDSAPDNAQWPDGSLAQINGTYNLTITNLTITTVFSISCTGPGGSQNDSVTVNVNSRPTATGLSMNNSDFCSTSPAYFFSWLYSDPDSDTQSGFEFQIDDELNFLDPKTIDRAYLNLSNPSPTINNQAATVLLSPQADHLTYNRTYYWRVRVADSNSLDSGWINGVPFSFSAPTHRSPDCDFTWSPINPNPEEIVNFTDSSICYDTGGNAVPCASWNWTFVDGDPAISNQQNQSTEFATSGTKDVTFTVTDGFGSQCSITRQVVVSLPLPKWKEIRPW